jgi:hypothetical protein
MLDNKFFLTSVAKFLRRGRVDRGTGGGKVVVVVDSSKRKVTFTKINCTIVYGGRTIVCGHKFTKTGLWMLPLQGSNAQATCPPAVSSEPTAKPTLAIAANVDATSSIAEYA